MVKVFTGIDPALYESGFDNDAVVEGILTDFPQIVMSAGQNPRAQLKWILRDVYRKTENNFEPKKADAWSVFMDYSESEEKNPANNSVFVEVHVPTAAAAGLILEGKDSTASIKSFVSKTIRFERLEVKRLRRDRKTGKYVGEYQRQDSEREDGEWVRLTNPDGTKKMVTATYTGLVIVKAG